MGNLGTCTKVGTAAVVVVVLVRGGEVVRAVDDAGGEDATDVEKNPAAFLWGLVVGVVVLSGTGCIIAPLTTRGW